MLSCNFVDRTRPKPSGILHRTKMQYVLRHFSWTLLFHQSCIDSPDTNSSILSQNVMVVKSEQSSKAFASIVLVAGGGGTNKGCPHWSSSTMVTTLFAYLDRRQYLIYLILHSLIAAVSCSHRIQRREPGRGRWLRRLTLSFGTAA